MALVRFATTCDATTCGRRSKEYTAWPSCRVCMRDTCPEHMEPGTLRQDEQVNACLCIECATLQLDEGGFSE